jgi:putative Mg2+ transporter-C (MgtC) family protein
MSTWEEITKALVREISDLNDAGDAVRVGVRMLLAALVGGLVGYERESQGKAAGIRTHILVALGSMLFVIVPQEAGGDEQSVSRVIQGLVAGIGFLGAGAIVKGHTYEPVQGLTTAAGIWMTAALGMTIAMGHGLTALMATALVLVVLRVIPTASPPPPPKPAKKDDAAAEPRPRPESKY